MLIWKFWEKGRSITIRKKEKKKEIKVKTQVTENFKLKIGQPAKLMPSIFNNKAITIYKLNHV